MRIIYSCYGGAHSSPVAAALHLGKLPRDRTPTAQELMSLSLYDETTNDQHGELFFIGKDDAGHEVYVLGRGPAGPTVVRAVQSGIRLGEPTPESQTVFVNTLVAVNTWMRIGGFLSRSVGLTRLGRPIVIHGTRKAFPDLLQRVEAVEKGLAAGHVEGDF